MAQDSIATPSQEMTLLKHDYRRRHTIKHYSPPGYIEIFKSRTTMSPNSSDALMSPVPGSEFSTTKVPEYFVLPIIEPENSLLSMTYTTYLDATRRLIESGISLDDILRSDHVAIDLFFRDRLPSDPWSISFWACELVKSFHGHDVFVLLAAVMMYTHLMRVCQSTAHDITNVTTNGSPVASRSLAGDVCTHT